MQIKRRKPDAPEINVGAFSDIAFLLIIFFILTTTFVRPAGEKLQIPAGTTDPEQKDRKQLTITLAPNEILYGEKGDTVTIEQLREKLLRERLPKRPAEDRIIILETDPVVPYETYFQAVMAITNAGGVLALVEPSDEEAPAP